MDRHASEGMDQGQRAEAQALREQWHRELKPVGVSQELLVDQIARAAWRLRRAAEWEETTGSDDRDWLRYQGQAERTFYRGLTELRRLVKTEAKAKRDAGKTAIEGRESTQMFGIPAVAAKPVGDCRPSPQPSPGLPGEGAKAKTEVEADPAPFAHDCVGGAGGEGVTHWRPVAESIQSCVPAQPPKISSMLSGAGAYSSGSML